MSFTPILTLARSRLSLRFLIHLGAWLPATQIIFQALSGDLTANPIQYLEQRTGRIALILLLLSLAVTPLNTLFGWRTLLPHRRTLGLYAFFYASLHALLFIDLDYGLAWRWIIQNILEKPYLLAGVAAFLLLIPLAITSFDIWKTRLGKAWKRLHRLVYLITLLVILHYAWGEKGDFFRLSGEVARPWAYALLFLLLMLLRLPPLRRALTSLRTRLRFSLSPHPTKTPQ